MAERTRIAWTDATWNPIRARHRVTGTVGWYCQRISEGCRHCYASTMNSWRGNGVDYTVPALAHVELYLDERILAALLRWRTPRRIFVCSMTDLFGEWVPEEWIDRIFAVMAQSPQHIFQILTKRSERMRMYCATATGPHHVCCGSGCPYCADSGRWPWARAPYPNVHLGVSIEDQASADARIPHLFQTPATVRVVSYEPALAPVDFAPYVTTLDGCWMCPQCSYRTNRDGEPCPNDLSMLVRDRALNWLICGGESGPHARPCDLAWIRLAIAQCCAAGVPCFVKQVGARPIVHGAEYGREVEGTQHPEWKRLRHRAGADPSEWPEDLRVREWPR